MKKEGRKYIQRKIDKRETEKIKTEKKRNKKWIKVEIKSKDTTKKNEQNK